MVAADSFLAFVCEMIRHVDGKKEIERVSTNYCVFADFGHLVVFRAPLNGQYCLEGICRNANIYSNMRSL
jgi:hypothetical protein